MEIEEYGSCNPVSKSGGSLPVENVQALAGSETTNKNILHRYLRSDIENDLIHNYGEEIPVIDFSKLVDSTCENEATKLKLACEQWGFFQLINHGVPEDVIEQVKSNLEEFFKLPLEEKKVYAQMPGSTEGYGQAFVVSEEQKLDWADMLFLGTQPKSFRNLKLWPAKPSTFREALDKYSTEQKRVGETLFKFMFEKLGLSEEEMNNLWNDGVQSMRINYYPPCSDANRVIGISPHSDAVGFTLLLQVSQVQGLQIRRNGGWLPVNPIPGAFIVNIGDILEIMSNGRYKSIEHRATVNTKKERISIATFHNPKYGSLIGPLPSLLQEGETEFYKTISNESYFKLIFSNKLDGKNILAQMKL